DYYCGSWDYGLNAGLF
nr:immunoglobulin light chain junction region [Macaca mulatta]